MTVFFVGWELWQEMTFVLACCIVAVFFIGTLRLWWTTRAMRKLEVLDEEKRARTSDVQHCGINAWHAGDIPFGVRALQTGVEVDGIWFSGLRATELSEVASSTTLMVDHLTEAKGKSKWSESSSINDMRPQQPFDMSTLGRSTIMRLDPPAHEEVISVPLVAGDRVDASHRNLEQHREQYNGEVRSYVPTGWNMRSSNGLDRAPGNTVESFSPAPHSAVSVKPPASSIPNVASSLPAVVHVNRATRRPNRHFEVLPAGTLGPRPELAELSSSKRCEEEIRLPHFQPGPAKLRKKNTLGSRNGGNGA